MNTNTGKKATYIDQFGEERVLEKTHNGWRLHKNELTPIIHLNQIVGKKIGENIKRLRLNKNMTMKTLGTLCGIPDPKKRIWALENNMRNTGIRMGTLYLMAMALDVEVEEILPSKVEVSSDMSVNFIQTPSL